MILAALLVAFIVYAVAELWLFVQVGDAIGWLNTIGVMILVSLVGVWLAKHEGLHTLTRMRQQVDAKRMPTDEVIDGVLILCGGLFLILPGFISDAIGLIILFPPTRALIRRFVKRRITIDITPISGRGPGPWDPPDDPNVIDV